MRAQDMSMILSSGGMVVEKGRRKRSYLSRAVILQGAEHSMQSVCTHDGIGVLTTLVADETYALYSRR